MWVHFWKFSEKREYQILKYEGVIGVFVLTHH